MGKGFVTVLFIILFAFGKTEVKSQESNNKHEILEIESIYSDGLELLLNKQDNNVYVINFWATWCKRCAEELPAFQQLSEKYKDKNVEVILVSLDFKKHLNTRLIPFIKEHNLKPTVVLMVDPDQNTWIPKVSPEWSGAIPATIIYTKNKRSFYEKSFTYEKLEIELKKFIKTN